MTCTCIHQFVAGTQLNEVEWFSYMSPIMLFMHTHNIKSGPAVVLMTVGNIVYFWGPTIMNHFIPRSMGAMLRYSGVGLALYNIWTAKWD